jgi:DNA polymerase III epsilon subunit-like protein
MKQTDLNPSSASPVEAKLDSSVRGSTYPANNPQPHLSNPQYPRNKPHKSHNNPKTRNPNPNMLFNPSHNNPNVNSMNSMQQFYPNQPNPNFYFNPMNFPNMAQSGQNLTPQQQMQLQMQQMQMFQYQQRAYAAYIQQMQAAAAQQGISNPNIQQHHQQFNGPPANYSPQTQFRQPSFNNSNSQPVSSEQNTAILNPTNSVEQLGNQLSSVNINATSSPSAPAHSAQTPSAAVNTIAMENALNNPITIENQATSAVSPHVPYVAQHQLHQTHQQLVQAPLPRSKSSSPTNKSGNSGNSAANDTPAFYSIDVECVACGPGHNNRAIAHIALVDQNERVLLNLYIKPKDPVYSYLPALTGLSEEIINKYGIELEDAIAQIVATLPADAMLVGQNILKDVQC